MITRMEVTALKNAINKEIKRLHKNHNRAHRNKADLLQEGLTKLLRGEAYEQKVQ